MKTNSNAHLDQYEYAYSRLGSAVRVLATGKGDVRSRLRIAYLSLITLNADRDLIPPEFREDFEWVMKSLTKYEPSPYQDGRLEATLERIKNKTGEKIATRIVRMHERLTNYYVFGFELDES